MQCTTGTGTVTTFVGSGKKSSKDGVGTVAGLITPNSMSYSKAGHCLYFIQDSNRVRRVSLPPTAQMRTALREAVSAGVEVVIIPPLIELIVAYILNHGTFRTEPKSKPRKQGS